MNIREKKFYWFVLGLFLSLFFPIYGEDVSNSYARIISQGKGIAVAVPTQVEFQFVRVSQNSDFDRALKAVQDFETKLRLKFTEESPRPVEIQSEGPLFNFTNGPGIEVKVTVVFSLAGIVSVENGDVLFAKLWDKMRNVAQEFSAGLKGPYLRVQNEEIVIRSAVNTAIEKAYPPADAGAGALRGSIYAVEKIEVNNIDWENDGRKEGTPLSLKEVRCVATVTVTYLISQM